MTFVPSVATVPLDIAVTPKKMPAGLEAQSDADADFEPIAAGSMFVKFVNARRKSLELNQLSYDPDADRLAEIRRQAAEGKTIKREDLLWALGAIGRLAGSGLLGLAGSGLLGLKDIEAIKDAAAKLVRSTPQEFQFPEYSAIIDRMACQAIPVRFQEQLFPEKEIELSTFDTEWRLLEFTPPVGPCDAVLVIRPWIRPQATTPASLVDILRAWRVQVFVDGERSLGDHPVEEFLVGPDGFGYREQAFAFPRVSGVLQVGLLEGYGPSHLMGVPDPEGLRPGWFLTRDQKLEVRLHPHMRELYGPVLMRTGLVAACYTTKASS